MRDFQGKDARAVQSFQIPLRSHRPGLCFVVKEENAGARSVRSALARLPAGAGGPESPAPRPPPLSLSLPLLLENVFLLPASLAVVKLVALISGFGGGASRVQ